MKNTSYENFIGSIDLNLPKQVHYLNALMDAKLYNWDCKIIVKILNEIEELYINIEHHKIYF